MHKIAIFASGAGSNALNIIRYFKNHPTIAVVLVVCNKPDAGVLSVAATEHIEQLLIERERFFHGDAYLPELERAGVDFIVLAGFLWKVPSTLIRNYHNNIINIHPALLPLYGGKGMYGSFVHEAVIRAGDRQSGISIHFVDEQYDHGSTIFQSVCEVLPTDTPEALASRIHQLEYEHYPKVIEQVLNAR